MIFTIINFTSIFLLKSIFLNYFFNESKSFQFPVEISSLVLISSDYLWSEYINWILLGWTGLPEELSYINKFDKFQWLNIFISWLTSLFLYNLFFLIKERFKYNYYKFKMNNLKFLVINYLSLFIWSLNTILNCTNNKYSFIEIFLSLLINIGITFFYPSLLLYLKNEPNNKQYFNSLNQSYKNNYYMFIEMIFKNLIGIYISFYYFWNIGNNYSLITINLVLIIFNFFTCNFKKKTDKKIYQISNFISLSIIIISEIEIILKKSVFTFIFKMILMGFLTFGNLFIIIKRKCNQKEVNNENNFIDIELGQKT